MDLDPLLLGVSQPTLFDLGDTNTGTLELFPTVWSAAEALTHPDVEVRQKGLSRLIEAGAVRLSPLVTYVVATRLADPDLDFRASIVKALADIYSPDSNGQIAPETVRQTLNAVLADMRSRRILALLQIAEFAPQLKPEITTLLSQCAAAGSLLADLLQDRKQPILVRKLAAHFLGEVGFCSAVPALERMAVRLESRINGQPLPAFISPDSGDETELLPDVQHALSQLNAP